MGDRTFSHVITVEDRATPKLDELLARHPEFAAVLPPDADEPATVFTADPSWPSDEPPPIEVTDNQVCAECEVCDWSGPDADAVAGVCPCCNYDRVSVAYAVEAHAAALLADDEAPTAVHAPVPDEAPATEGGGGDA